MMMEDSQFDISLELQKKELESEKARPENKEVWDPDKETLLQLEELQRKGNALGIEFPYLKEMIKTLQLEIKSRPLKSLAAATSKSLAAANSACAEEALCVCLRNIIDLVAKRVTQYHTSFTSFINLVYDYLKSRVNQMEPYQDSLMSHHVGLLYEKEDMLNKRETLQDERLNELIEKFYPLCVLIGEKKSEKPSNSEDITTTGSSSSLGSQDTQKEEEEDNEEEGDIISNKTPYNSESEEEQEENATSFNKELESEKAPQNDADDEDEIATWEKERILQLKKTSLDLVRMCHDLSLQLASKKEEIKSYQSARVPRPESIEKRVSMIMDMVLEERVVRLDDDGFGLIKNMLHACLKAAIEKVVEFYAFQLNTIDNLLNEMGNLVNEKGNVLNKRDAFIDEVHDFINEKEKLENEKYGSSKLWDKKTKKRSFADITTTGNSSPERRTRSHLLFQEEEEEIPNKTQHTENEEGGENATSSA